jgi:hypothetical protein
VGGGYREAQAALGEHLQVQVQQGTRRQGRNGGPEASRARSTLQTRSADQGGVLPSRVMTVMAGWVRRRTARARGSRLTPALMTSPGAPCPPRRAGRRAPADPSQACWAAFMS